MSTKCRILNVVASGTYSYNWTFNGYKFGPTSLPNMIFAHICIHRLVKGIFVLKFYMKMTAVMETRLTLEDTERSEVSFCVYIVLGEMLSKRL
jgi:hypothetical protein